MPLYDFKCERCGNVIERYVKMDVRTALCACGGIQKRMISRNYYVHDDIDVVTEDLYPDRPVHITSRRQLKKLMEEHKVVERYGKGWI